MTNCQSAFSMIAPPYRSQLNCRARSATLGAYHGCFKCIRDKNLPELAVVVPTYREAANLPELARRIYDAVKEAGISTEIVVVDDNSQDGTDKVCKELAAHYPLRLVTRFSERGLARSVIHGIRESQSAYVLVMDADLSHPPEDIPRFLQHLREGADFCGWFAICGRRQHRCSMERISLVEFTGRNPSRERADRH